MNSNPAKDLAQSLAGALKGVQLYAPDHPGAQQRLQQLCRQLIAMAEARKSFRIGVVEGALLIDEHLFTESSPGAEAIAVALQGGQLAGLEFCEGIEEEEIRRLIPLLLSRWERFDQFDAALRAQGIRHIRPLNAEEEKSPRHVYGRAIKVVEAIFRDARMGKVPSSHEAVEVVRSMAQLTLTAPHALFALTMLKDYDNYTFTHSVNVSVIAMAVGRACGLAAQELRTLGLGALLHDLGKLKVDIDIINKPGRLTSEEFTEVMKHPATGAALVARMENVTPEVLDIVLGHHLRYDRKGYPADARGREISPMAEMAAIADAFDAMTTLRSYQRPVTPRRAIDTLRQLSGKALHPGYLESFIAFLGPYPVGSLVRLVGGEVALVVWIDVDAGDHMRLKVLFDEQARRLDPPAVLELRGTELNRIVAEIEPHTRAISIADYLDDFPG